MLNSIQNSKKYNPIHHVGNGLYHVLQGGAASATWTSKSISTSSFAEVVVWGVVVVAEEKGHFFFSFPMPPLVFPSSVIAGSALVVVASTASTFLPKRAIMKR
eukprot:TRINITY_DN17842_c0_g1_i1.p1 TRINITY_DN17842_c0_g1~~TRINITY_DN17842_c0_g1_i1.p1  ORF type:complete len:103 (-),score=3.03 TRINITY_DN17842_c0_g1_i1:111-419(-)